METDIETKKNKTRNQNTSQRQDTQKTENSSSLTLARPPFVLTWTRFCRQSRIKTLISLCWVATKTDSNGHRNSLWKLKSLNSSLHTNFRASCFKESTAYSATCENNFCRQTNPTDRKSHELHVTAMDCKSQITQVARNPHVSQGT